MSVPNSWKIFAAKTAQVEKKYTPQVEKAIKSAYKTFLSDLRQYGLERAKANLNQLALNTDLIPVLTGIYSKAGVLGARMTSNELKAAAKQKAANIGRNESWIREVLNYLKMNLLQFVSNISNTTRNDILAIIEGGVEDGMGAEAIARIIEEKIPQIALARARVITRTECVRAMNSGKMIGARDFRYEVNKRWISAKDERTRRGHKFINGHTVGENETFKVPIYKKNVLVGYDNMQHPGDSNADPSNTCNCRCTVTFIPVRDGNGRLIPRRNNVPVMTTYSPARTMAVV